MMSPVRQAGSELIDLERSDTSPARMMDGAGVSSMSHAAHMIARLEAENSELRARDREAGATALMRKQERGLAEIKAELLAQMKAEVKDELFAEVRALRVELAQQMGALKQEQQLLARRQTLIEVRDEWARTQVAELREELRRERQVRSHDHADRPCPQLLL